MRFFCRRERLLFHTHEPPFRLPAFGEGRVVEHEGRLYRITRWVELRPVHLERGGSVGQWQVWGRPLSDRELRQGIVGAAEAILADSPSVEDPR